MGTVLGISYHFISGANMIISINTVPYGSTAKIMVGIANLCETEGIRNITSTGYSHHPIRELPLSNIIIGNVFDKSIHMMLGRFTGYQGCYSHVTTKRFLKTVEELHPDTIHLHNIHGWFLNFPMLFDYIKQNRIRVIWTLHDCWAFTGRCPYFKMAKCDKWKTGCGNCPYPKDRYPQAFVDKTAKMWLLKKKRFTGVENMMIVTPSRWLADLVGESFLKDYPVKVIHNGIDLSVFKPAESNFRQKHNIGDKYMLLGIADSWGVRKGLDVFVGLSKRLDPVKYQIVLVGTNDSIDKQLPDNIISIHRTQNQKELAEIYTAADLFVNPTREENYPTVNMESIACGTPVLTFRTGGSPEILDETCGSVVDCDNIDALESEIIRIAKKKPFTTEMCLHRAGQFDQNERFKEYIDLYQNGGQ